ncbi:MAG: phage scaffolding protein [Clostridia bacterium]
MDKNELIAMGVEEAVAEVIEGEFNSLSTSWEEKVAQVEKDFQVELILRDKGAKNIKAVRALLEDGDMDSIKSQIESLTKNKDTRFLFESGKKSFEPYQSGQKLPDVTKNDYEMRLKEARSKGNSVEAIRIKQQAAQEGIMLI